MDKVDVKVKNNMGKITWMLFVLLVISLIILGFLTYGVDASTQYLNDYSIEQYHFEFFQKSSSF